MTTQHRSCSPLTFTVG